MTRNAWQSRARDALVGAGCRALALPFLVSRRCLPDRPRRVVIVKQGSIGDVLMATPSVRALRQCLPDAHLAFAVGAWSRPVIAGNPNLDAIVDLGSLGGRSYPLRDYLAAARRLRAGRYDLALILDRAPLLTLLPWLAGIPARVGLDSAGRGFSLSAGVPCPPRRHEVDLYLDVARAAGCVPTAPRLEFFPSSADRVAAQEIAGGAAGRPLVAIHPGGGVNPGMALLAKRWPVAGFAALAERLHSDLGAALLLIGGVEDRATVEALRSVLPVPAIDLVGKLTWGQLGALFELVRLLVANDTGAAHIAAAVGTPAVVLFGPTDPSQYGPYGGLGEAVTAGASCSPCFQRGRFPPCPFGQRCLTSLAVETVWPAVLRQWSRRPAPPPVPATSERW